MRTIRRPAGPSGRKAERSILRKPLKMRWDYDQPKGKLFIGDGKYLWLYTPAENTAEKMKLKESDDMRAPLAFLLGKLDFQKEFRNLQAKPEGADTRITAEPKTDNLPYSGRGIRGRAGPAHQGGQGDGLRSLDYSSSASTRRRWTRRWMPSCSSSRCPRARSWWRACSSHGRIRPEVRRRARGDPPAGGHGRLRKGTAREVRPAGLPDLLDQGPRPGPAARRFFGGRKKLNLEKFLIFNQQFVTLIRAGLPILKALDLLADRLTDPETRAVHQGRPRRSAQRHAALAKPSGSRASSPRSTSPR